MVGGLSGVPLEGVGSILAEFEVELAARGLKVEGGLARRGRNGDIGLERGRSLVALPVNA